MNFSELKLNSALLAEIDGYSDTSPPPDWAMLVNQALGEFSRIAEYHSETGVLTTVVNQIQYALPFLNTFDSDWIRVTDMIFNSAGTPGASGSQMYLTDKNQLRRNDGMWMVMGPGTPTHYYHLDPNHIGLYPPPSSVLSIAFEGLREAPLLILETDTPTFPAFFHDAIPLLAQWRHLRKYNPPPIALKNYEEGVEKAKSLRRELYAAQAPAFQIKLQLESPLRQTLGGWTRQGR